MENFKQQIMETYNEIADDFDPTRPHPWPESVEFIKTLPKGIRILDLGCGNGRNSIYIAQQNLEVVGVDFAIKMLKIANKKNLELKSQTVPNFLQADIMELPFKDQTFDAALFIAALHHIPNEDYRLHVLEELFRCLKPGGQVLISVWAFDQPRFQEVLLEQLVTGDEPIEPAKKPENEPESVPGGNIGDVYVPWTRKDGKVFKRFYHLFDEDELRELLAKTEFVILDVYRVQDNYYAKVAKK
ncbi:MAG: class I SAM-dependent methyltransferase [Thermoplasmata archaeon]|nr:class I SAM-dependent methyltransferase [Thermoplasmata archaeon]